MGNPSTSLVIPNQRIRLSPPSFCLFPFLPVPIQGVAWWGGTGAAGEIDGDGREYIYSFSFGNNFSVIVIVLLDARMPSPTNLLVDEFARFPRLSASVRPSCHMSCLCPFFPAPMFVFLSIYGSKCYQLQQQAFRFPSLPLRELLQNWSPWGR